MAILDIHKNRTSARYSSIDQITEYLASKLTKNIFDVDTLSIEDRYKQEMFKVIDAIMNMGCTVTVSLDDTDDDDDGDEDEDCDDYDDDEIDDDTDYDDDLDDDDSDDDDDDF